MFGADRGEPSADLAARLSMNADGYTDNTAFDALCHQAQGSFRAADVVPPTLRTALEALGNFEEGFTVFDAVATSCRIEDTMLDPLSLAAKDAEGTPWPTPYSTPDFDDPSFIPAEGLAGADDEIDRLAASFGDVQPAMRVAGDTSSRRARDFRKVVLSAALAGTPIAGKTAQELLRKSVQIAALADDRAKLATQARAGFQRTLREVDALDARAKLLARQLLDEQGKPRRDLTLADLERLKKLRARATSLGRRAVRYQKVNALATPLAQNAIAQADILQKAAAAVLAGDTGAAAGLGKLYDALGAKSAEIRQIRAQQLAKWSKKSELEGLAAFASLDDPYESPLNALERADVVALAGLEFSIRKFARKAGRTLKRAAKKAVVSPTKTAISVARKAASGNIRGAFKEVGGAVRGAARDIANAAGKVFLDYPCKLASTTVGKAAIQAAGQAVGTAYGGPAGGALGSEAGRQAGATNQSICGGLRRIGVTDGTFRPGQVKGAFAKVARDVYKTSLSPEAALLAAKNVSAGLLAGGAGLPSLPGLPSQTELLSKLGASTLSKLGAGNLQSLVGRRIERAASAQAQRAVAQTARRMFPSELAPATVPPEYEPPAFLKDYL